MEMDCSLDPVEPLFSVHGGPSRTAHIVDTHHKIASAIDAHVLAEQLAHSIRNVLDDGTIDVARLRQFIDQQDEAHRYTRDFLDTCMSSIPVELRPTASSALKAQQVFGTPELLEQIFLYLTPREVLIGRQTNKSASQTFDDSPKLRDHLSLRPLPNGFLTSLFDASPGSFIPRDDAFTELQLCFEVQYDRVPSPSLHGWASPEYNSKHANRVTVTLDWLHRTLPKIGDVCRGMLICQPPAKTLNIHINCCDISGASRAFPAGRANMQGWRGSTVSNVASGIEDVNDEESHKSDEAEGEKEFDFDVTETLFLRSKNGITVGDVYDATQKLRDAHRNCPNASIRLHDEHGIVVPSITFSTTLVLKRDDQYLIEAAESELQNELDMVQAIRSPSTVTGEILGVYVKAKRTARDNGWPIPTFEEFKARHSVGDAM